VNRNIRDISTKLSSRRQDPAWKQETRTVVFISGDEMFTFIQNRVTKCNKAKHTTCFKSCTTKKTTKRTIF